MRSQFYAAILLGLAALVNFAGCANAPENNPNTSVPAPEATPDKVAIETELTRIENDWPRIIRERDGATVRRVEADDLVIIYPDGTVGNKEQDAKDIEAGYFTFDSWDTLEVKVNVVSKNLATVLLRYNVKNGVIKSPDGRSESVSGQYLSLDTFALRNGQWQFIGLSSVQVKTPVSGTPAASPSASVPVAPKPAASVRSSPLPRSSPVTRPSPVAKPSVTRPTPPRVAATPVSTP